MAGNIDWAEFERWDAEYRRTIPNVANIARKMNEDRSNYDGPIADQLKHISKRLEGITMMVLEISTYIAGHEKSMSAGEFAEWVGYSPATIRKKMNDSTIPTIKGRIPPRTLRKYGVGPTSSWPRHPRAQAPQG